MKFEIFSCCAKTEQARTGMFPIDIVIDLMTQNDLCDCETWTDSSTDKKKFIIILCCANRSDYKQRGKRLALNLGASAMERYLEKDYLGRNSPSTYSILEDLTHSWRERMMREGRTSPPLLLKNSAPSFMAIAGNQEKILFVQYGPGCFVVQKGDTCGTYSFEYKNKYSHVDGFALHSTLYFQELTAIPHTAVMVTPYAFRNVVLEETFQKFTKKIEMEYYSSQSIAFCIEPFRKLMNRREVRNSSCGIAGYWVIEENHATAKVPPTWDCPQYQGQIQNTGQAYGSRQSKSQGRCYPYPANPDFQSTQEYGQKPDSLTKPASSGFIFHKQREQKQQEQLLQQLTTIKQDLQTKEQQLIRLKQMQKDISKQQDNLSAGHQKTLSWMNQQEEYLDSKRKMNRQPQD